MLPDWHLRWATSKSTLREFLRLIGSSDKNVERVVIKRCSALVVLHSPSARDIPDRCIVVADQTHIHGLAMIRPRGRSLVSQPLAARAPDHRPHQRVSSIVAISCNTVILELSVKEVPPAQSGDDWLAFCTSLAGHMNGYVLGALWAAPPQDCVLLYDKFSVHNPAAHETMNGALLLHLPPCCPNLSSIEPSFADYKHAVGDLAYRHPEMPDRLSQVLAFASVPLTSIRGHYREARRELTAPRKPLEGFLPPLPVELAPPLP